ncbi:hypothetical protein PENSPDRAFT_750472 [Peniophora sp. CONT]|nr:hypothetical protein PENSPDRAFT_750472 [Peniophora sp. CONT]
MPAPGVMITQLNQTNDPMKLVADWPIFPVMVESMLFCEYWKLKLEHRADKGLACQAMYTALMIFYCIKYWSSKRRASGILSVSICLYILCSICWVFDCWMLWNALVRILPSRPLSDEDGLRAHEALQESDGNVRFARNACELTVFVLADTISLWRAYVLYSRPRLLKILFSIMLIVYIVLFSLDLILRDVLFLKSPPAFAVRFSHLDSGLYVLALGELAGSWAAFTQVLATVMIAKKALLHRREVQDLLPVHRSSADSLRATAVLYIVLETGITYTIIFISYILLTAGVFGISGGIWADFLMCQISGICPMLVVVVVSLRTSILEQNAMNALANTTGSLHVFVDGDVEDRR